MFQSKKPMKKKFLRRKEKFDIDALEAEAISAGLGATDLGSRNDSKRQAAREEKERSEAARRNIAFQHAYAKAEEASRELCREQMLTTETPVFADYVEDSEIVRATKLLLNKQNEKAAAGPEAIAHLALGVVKGQPAVAREADNKVVFTEMEEFVWGLQLDKVSSETQKLDENKNETGVLAEIADEQEVVPDEIIHEAPVGKGLSGVLKLLKDRGALKETIERGGRNMDRKKNKVAELSGEGSKEINLDRTDEYGQTLSSKDAFRLFSHKFHGKRPGKMKQEKRMKQYQDQLKLKQMTCSDNLPRSVQRIKDAQSKLRSPYLLLSGHLKPGI